MRFYFTTNEHYYSRWHRHVAKEPFTHIGIGLFLDDFDLVIDCTKPYGKLYHAKHWFSKYYLVTSLDLELSKEDEKRAYDHLVEECVLTPYDWGAYYYAVKCALLKYFFNIPYPKVNRWAGQGMWCTEIMKVIEPVIKQYGLLFKGISWDTKTPYMAYQILREQPGVKEIHG